jgi:hypothetical protein
MGYFKEVVPKRVELSINDVDGKPYWVDVKTDLKYGDIKNFAGIAKDGQVDTGTSMDTFLKSAIVAWNLDNEAGEIVPIDTDSINKLESKDATAIITIAGASVAGKKEEDADFLSESAATSKPDELNTLPQN